MAYSTLTKRTYFLYWDYACSLDGIDQRLHSSNHYYFQLNQKSSFQDLIISDLLALMLVYADLVAELNKQSLVPSLVIKTVWNQLAASDWDTWLRDANLTGVKAIDEMICNLGKSGIKNE